MFLNLSNSASVKLYEITHFLIYFFFEMANSRKKGGAITFIRNKNQTEANIQSQNMARICKKVIATLSLAIVGTKVSFLCWRASQVSCTELLAKWFFTYLGFEQEHQTLSSRAVVDDAYFAPNNNIVSHFKGSYILYRYCSVCYFQKVTTHLPRTNLNFFAR